MSGSQQSSGRGTGAGSGLRAVDGLHPDWLSDDGPTADTPPGGDSGTAGVVPDAARREPAESFAPDFDGDQLDLEERNSLRRVAGLSTQLADISEVEYRDLQLERVVLVGVWTSGTAHDAENSLVELKSLAETAGAEVLDGLVQRRQRPDIATYIGSGKVDEVRAVVSSTEADTVICDGELSPAQLRNLEERLKVKVIDRTGLILDIFAQHARSREGRAQVELAQLSYLLPRLRGWGGNLSRQAGGRAAGGVGIGGRGPGETKIEIDRRRVRTRMSRLRKEISGMTDAREVQRHQRTASVVPSVAIAGYTNAGKSSILNRLTGAGALVDDSLFATLDPTTRRSTTPDGRTIVLTDTVGFVRHLPHELIEAFRSTLEEVSGSDLLVHVVDASHPDPEGQILAVREVLNDSGAGDLPEIIAINKADVADPVVVQTLHTRYPGSVTVSARTGDGIDDLLAAIADRLPRPEIDVQVTVPYSRGDLVSRIHEQGEVLSLEHGAQGSQVHARVDAALAHDLEDFATENA
jgi:GTP-binding protein HflX